MMTWLGKTKSSNGQDINVLSAALTDGLKRIILNRSKTFQNLDTILQMECVSATNVTITEYIAECLITNTVSIAKRLAIDKLQGNERELVGKYKRPDGTDREYEGWESNNKTSTVQNKAPTTAECRNLTKGTSEYEGWGTA